MEAILGPMAGFNNACIEETGIMSKSKIYGKLCAQSGVKKQVWINKLRHELAVAIAQKHINITRIAEVEHAFGKIV